MSETLDFYTPNQANIEQLRVILEDRSGTKVSFEEAEEVGIQLVSLYECLARERESPEEQSDDNSC